MATVHVTKVTEGWPQGNPEEGDPNLTTIDCTVDGKYVRMGYLQSAITSSSDVENKLTNDASILKDASKQHDDPFPDPSGGADRPDWIPADFTI